VIGAKGEEMILGDRGIWHESGHETGAISSETAWLDRSRLSVMRVATCNYSDSGPGAATQGISGTLQLFSAMIA